MEVRGVIANPSVGGGGTSQKYTFTYSLGLDGGETINDIPITKDHRVFELEAGSINYLYYAPELGRLYTDSGTQIPTLRLSGIQTRVPAQKFTYRFIMPSENAVATYM